MPKYNLYCDSCGKDHSMSCRMSEYIECKPSNCDTCGGNIVKSLEDYNKLNTQGTDGKRNPNSINFWKNGKSKSQVADVLAQKIEPY